MVLALGSSMVAPVIPVYAKSFDVALSTAALVFVAYNMGALAATFPRATSLTGLGGGRCCCPARCWRRWRR